uniref:Major allergen I polypeptide chain 1-like isoform X1 n=1 Tax=Callorhinus ursinus TaxID=34884 RepID=A0A3Q7MTJ7_CALUR|nr:major allergen I polypeptide chain 1-like isoform X1 [Callorhinus ursinus]
MKLAGTLELLWAASLLLSGRDCKICSAVSDDVTLFLTGTTEAYVQEVAQYQNESIILENAKSLKECVDGKMTADDKTNAVNVLEIGRNPPLPAQTQKPSSKQTRRLLPRKGPVSVQKSLMSLVPLKASPGFLTFSLQNKIYASPLC